MRSRALGWIGKFQPTSRLLISSLMAAAMILVGLPAYSVSHAQDMNCEWDPIVRILVVDGNGRQRTGFELHLGFSTSLLVDGVIVPADLMLNHLDEHNDFSVQNARKLGNPNRNGYFVIKESDARVGNDYRFVVLSTVENWQMPDDKVIDKWLRENWRSLPKEVLAELRDQVRGPVGQNDIDRIREAFKKRLPKPGTPLKVTAFVTYDLDGKTIKGEPDTEMTPNTMTTPILVPVRAAKPDLKVS